MNEPKSLYTPMTFDEWFTLSAPCNQLAAILKAAWDAATAARDFEWWEAVVLVDNVAPTPEAAKDYLIHERQYHIEEAVAEKNAELAALRLELEGEKKANALLNAGMGEVCDDRDRMKHELRELRAENERLKTELAAERQHADELAKVLGDIKSYDSQLIEPEGYCGIHREEIRGVLDKHAERREEQET